jgi:hypothetical protein
MAAGGGEGTLWIKILIAGGVLVGVANGIHMAHVGPTWLLVTLLAVGGSGVVFGSCEAMIVCIQGIAGRLKWNKFVAGTMAGLASNVPEVVMLGFVIAKDPRIGFIVVAFTLHIGAAAFGLYSALLPRDGSGHARMPEPLVKLSTDLFACAAGVFLATGGIMMLGSVFGGGSAELLATDLYVIGGCLLFVEIVAVFRLLARFSKNRPKTKEELAEDEAMPEEDEVELMSTRAIVTYGLIGVLTSVLGGHAVGEFADILVTGMRAAGYSEMLGALILSIFACAGAIAMIATAHSKGLYDIALANVSGWINQVPFVVMPIALIMIALFSQLGVTTPLPGGGVLPIDLETTSVFLLAFPPLLILWKAVQDDGYVNWVETAAMLAVFILTIYFLVQHG